MVARTDAGPSDSQHLRRWRLRIGGAIADLLFPPRCVTCRRWGAWLCPACAGEIEAIRPPVCARCGQPISSASPSPQPVGVEAYCGRCRTAPSTQLDGLRAFALHSGPLRTVVHQLKYAGLRSLAPSLGRLMAQGWDLLQPEGIEFDAIVPVPLHTSRQRERGYNQAALLAAELAAQLGRPYVQDLLQRTRATAPQVGLDAYQRQINVHDAFRCRRSGLPGLSVLLIDDVCTTGSTLDAAASALRAGGARCVWGYVLARARLGSFLGSESSS